MHLQRDNGPSYVIRGAFTISGHSAAHNRTPRGPAALQPPENTNADLVRGCYQGSTWEDMHQKVRGKDGLELVTYRLKLNQGAA